MGIVTDGAVRDGVAVGELDIPVYGIGATPILKASQTAIEMAADACRAALADAGIEPAEVGGLLRVDAPFETVPYAALVAISGSASSAPSGRSHSEVGGGGDDRCEQPTAYGSTLNSACTDSGRCQNYRQPCQLMRSADIAQPASDK